MAWGHKGAHDMQRNVFPTWAGISLSIYWGALLWRTEALVFSISVCVPLSVDTHGGASGTVPCTTKQLSHIPCIWAEIFLMAAVLFLGTKWGGGAAGVG